MKNPHTWSYPVLAKADESSGYSLSAVDYPDCKATSDTLEEAMISIRRQLEEITWEISFENGKIIEPSELSDVAKHTNKYSFITQVDIAKRYQAVPKIIYYYMPISENLMKMLADPYIWFSNPKTFNDPFELPDVFHKNWTGGEEWKDFEFIFREFKDNLPVLKQYESAHDAFTILKIHHDNMIQEVLNLKIKLLDESLHAARVSCFSRYYDNTLMWSHYSNKHTGVVIGYELGCMFSGKPNIIHSDVDYRLHPEKIRTGECAGAIEDVVKTNYISRKLLTKHPSWAYEQEYRLLSIGHGIDGKYPVKKESICELHFGCQIDPSVRSALMSIVNGAGISLYDMKKSNEIYLERKKIL